MRRKPIPRSQLLAENAELRRQLDEADAALRAIRAADVDALVLTGPAGEHIVTLPGADLPYRVMVQSMNEGALTLLADGSIAFCNPRFAEMVHRPAEALIGAAFQTLLPESEHAAFAASLRQMSRAEARGEFHLRRPDSSTLTVQLSGQPLSAPGVEAVIVVATNLTERQRAEAQAQFQAQLLAAVGQAVIASDQAGRIVYWNPAAEALYGWPAAEVLGRNIGEIMVSDASQAQAAEIMERLAAGRDWSGEFDVRRRDGTTFPAYVTDSPVRDAAGRPTGIIGVSFDISERRQAEEALRMSEEIYRDLFENSIVGMAQVRPDAQRFLRVNQAYARMYGYGSPEEMVAEVTDIGRQIYARVEDREAVRQHVYQPGVPEPVEIEVLRRDGTHFFVLAAVRRVMDAGGNLLYYQSTHSDITERKRAEQALRSSEETYRDLFANSMVGIAQVHPDGKHLLRANQAYARMYGYGSSEEMIAQVTDIRLTYARAEDHAVVRERLKGADITEPFELPALRRDGTRMVILATLLRVCDAAGNLLYYQTTQSDITDRQRVEDSLRESEKSYRELFENSMVGISQALPDGRLYRVNKAYAHMYGYASPEEMMAEVTDLVQQLYVHPEEREAITRYVDNHGAAEPRELEVLRRDGTHFYALVAVQAIHDAGGRLLYYQATHDDITALKQAELQIRRRLAELEAVQHISAALRVAHTVEEMLPRLLQEMLAILDTDAGAIWLLDAAHSQLRLAVAAGWYLQPEIGAAARLDEGITGRVLQTLQPYVSREFASDPLNRDAVRPVIPLGWGGAAVPILNGQQAIGVLHASVQLPRVLLPPELHLLTTLSEIAGSAIQRSVLHEQTEHRLHELAALSEIDRAIVSTFDLEVILSVLIDKVIPELGVDAADVLLLEAGSHRLRYVAGKGFRAPGFSNLDLRLGEGYAGRAAVERRLIHVPDLGQRNDSPRLAKVLPVEGFVSYFGVPLFAKGLVKGVLEVFQRAPLEPDDDWLNFLNALAGQAAIAIDNTTLFNDLERSNIELSLAYDATIEGWSRALDLRDKETEGHSLRVTELSMKLARAMGLSDAALAQARWGALLHDIGKMGVPDRILLKPGPLTDDEWVIMKQHPTLAYQMLSPIRHLRLALDIPYCHHEKWDGSGYPRGLAGEQIPLAARAFAVVDVWDALISDRPYRRAWPAEQVRQHIQSLAGTHFDPNVVRVAIESGLFDEARRE